MACAGLSSCHVMSDLRGAAADPGNWGVPPYAAADFASSFVYERAQIARAQNKPFILEETGKEVSAAAQLSCNPPDH